MVDASDGQYVQVRACRFHRASSAVRAVWFRPGAASSRSRRVTRGSSAGRMRCAMSRQDLHRAPDDGVPQS